MQFKLWPRVDNCSVWSRDAVYTKYTQPEVDNWRRMAQDGDFLANKELLCGAKQSNSRQVCPEKLLFKLTQLVNFTTDPWQHLSNRELRHTGLIYQIRWPSKLQSSWGRLTAAPGLASHAQGWLALIWRIALGDLYWPRCILFLAVSSQRVRTFHVADQSMPSSVVCDQVQHCERRIIQMIFGFNLNTMTKGCKEKHRPRYFPLNVVLVLKTLPQLLTSQ